jgi:hypothetical protein
MPCYQKSNIRRLKVGLRTNGDTDPYGSKKSTANDTDSDPYGSKSNTAGKLTYLPGK